MDIDLLLIHGGPEHGFRGHGHDGPGSRDRQLVGLVGSNGGVERRLCGLRAGGDGGKLLERLSELAGLYDLAHAVHDSNFLIDELPDGCDLIEHHEAESRESECRFSLILGCGLREEREGSDDIGILGSERRTARVDVDAHTRCEQVGRGGGNKARRHSAVRILAKEEILEHGGDLSAAGERADRRDLEPGHLLSAGQIRDLGVGPRRVDTQVIEHIGPDFEVDSWQTASDVGVRESHRGRQAEADEQIRITGELRAQQAVVRGGKLSQLRLADVWIASCDAPKPGKHRQHARLRVQRVLCPDNLGLSKRVLEVLIRGHLRTVLYRARRVIAHVHAGARADDHHRAGAVGVAACADARRGATG